MIQSAEQVLILVLDEAESNPAAPTAQTTLMSLGAMMEEYHRTFGEVPRCIKGALQILLTKGKVKVQFGNGMSERIELNDYTDLLNVGEAIHVLNECESRLVGSRVIGAPE